MNHKYKQLEIITASRSGYVSKCFYHVRLRDLRLKQPTMSDTAWLARKYHNRFRKICRSLIACIPK